MPHVNFIKLKKGIISSVFLSRAITGTSRSTDKNTILRILFNSYRYVLESTKLLSPSITT